MKPMQEFMPYVTAIEAPATRLRNKALKAHEKYLEDPTIANERAYAFALRDWAKVTCNTKARIHALRILEGTDQHQPEPNREDIAARLQARPSHE